MLGLNAFGAWVLTPALMAAFSFQTLFLSNEYAAHVKDRSTLAAEVLHEYDEKVRVMAYSLSCPAQCRLCVMQAR